VHALVPFAFKEAQEFLANFRAGRHHVYCNVIGFFTAFTAKVAKDAKGKKKGVARLSL
jgi:hypothetical protein